jgi:hypothetical protein
MPTRHTSTEELARGLTSIRESPQDAGVLHLIVRRPAKDVREVLDIGSLDTAEGLVGDMWRTRGSSRTSDRSSHPGMQLAIMNSRVIALVARDPARWALAGDQLYVDLDLSASNLPAGTRLSLGTAMIEITDEPHTGCRKFAARFGIEATKFLASPEATPLNLRGIYARVIQSGVIRAGDVIRKQNATHRAATLGSGRETK